MNDSVRGVSAASADGFAAGEIQFNWTLDALHPADVPQMAQVILYIMTVVLDALPPSGPRTEYARNAVQMQATMTRRERPTLSPADRETVTRYAFGEELDGVDRESFTTIRGFMLAVSSGGCTTIVEDEFVQDFGGFTPVEGLAGAVVEFVGDGVEFSNGLVCSLPHGGALVDTGIHTGDVLVTLDMRTTEPALDLGPWEDVIDVSILIPAVGITLVDLWSNEDRDYPTLTTSAAGTYRLRCHARGRDLNPDGTSSEMEGQLENYLLTLWPAPPTTDTTHQLTSTYGKQSRICWSG